MLKWILKRTNLKIIDGMMKAKQIHPSRMIMRKWTTPTHLESSGDEFID